VRLDPSTYLRCTRVWPLNPGVTVDDSVADDLQSEGSYYVFESRLVGVNRQNLKFINLNTH
jgi:hypothetical protein